jgi:hypothetical protein
MVFLRKATGCNPERCLKKFYLTILRKFRIAMGRVLSTAKAVSSTVRARM